MDQDFVLYERQPDGKYTRSGELPKGTRYATVITPDTVEGTRAVVKKAKEWEAILDAGPLKKVWYKMVAAPSPHPMSDKAKEKLQALAEEKKAVEAVRE